MKTCDANKKRREGGFALLVVIVVMLLASFLASQLILEVRTELKIFHNHKKRAVERFLAEAGLNLGLFRLLDTPVKIENLTDEKAESFHHGQTYEESALSAGKFLYYVVSETGKIDLNKSSPDLLKLFLQYQGLEQEQIEVISDSLQDWRDGDDLHHLNGAESEYYKNLPRPYVVRNGNMDDPTEFFLVKGTEVLAGRFAATEVFTVNNTTGKINFNNLTPAVLDFLTDKDAEKQAAYRELLQEQDGKLNASHAQLILGDERYQAMQNYLSFESPGREANNSPYYSVVGIGLVAVADEAPREKDGKEESVPGTRITAMIEKGGSGFIVRSWKEDTT